ncbi:MAG: putative lipid II flippase FtsW [bacterium]
MSSHRIFSNEVTLGALSLFLVASGLLFIYSTSSVYSLQQHGNQYHFFYRQLIYAATGIGLMLLLASFDYRELRPLAAWMLLASGGLMLLVWVPGLGKTVRGARRWIDLGPLSFQPSELVKITLVFFFADRLSRASFQQRKAELFAGYVKYWICALPLLVLVLAQKDFGSTVICGIVVFLLLFLAGARWRYMALTVAAALPAAVVLCLDSYRWERIRMFADPWKDPYGAGYQLVQSYISLGLGGTFGVGLGNGTQKLFYLPDAHTDFIFSVLGEELGLAGCCAFLILFLLFIVQGVRIALRAPDRFGTLLAAGITFLIGVEFVLNVAVVLGLLPTKGMVLPFLSYGGSALLINLMAVGILCSVGRQEVLRPDLG